MKRETIKLLRAKGLKLRKCAEGYLLSVANPSLTVEVNYGSWKLTGSTVIVSNEVHPGQVSVYDEFNDPHH